MSPLMLHVAALLTTACVAGLWQGCAMVLMGAVMCRWMPRASAALRHTLLLLLFAGALLLPFLPLRTAVDSTTRHGVQLAASVSLMVAACWLVMALFRGIQLGQAWHHLCAVRRSAIVLESQGSVQGSAVGRMPVLCRSSHVDSPTILGFWSPRLLLPDWMANQLTPDELRQIALHECEHLRRGDDWTNLMLQVGLVLSPLNPALFWLNRVIGRQRELAVDAAVVAQTGQPIAYATCLTRLAEQRLRRGRLRLALAAWEQRSELAQRVHVLLTRTPRWSSTQSSWATVAAAAVLTLALSGMARVPQLVSVAEAPGNTVAGQAPVTPMPAASFNRANVFGGIRMQQASFGVRPGQLPALRPPTRHVAARRKTSLARSRSRFVIANRAVMRNAALSYLSVSFDGDTPPSISTNAPERMTPAVLYLPLVAVPVEHGWLLINL